MPTTIPSFLNKCADYAVLRDLYAKALLHLEAVETERDFLNDENDHINRRLIEAMERCTNQTGTINALQNDIEQLADDNHDIREDLEEARRDTDAAVESRTFWMKRSAAHMTRFRDIAAQTITELDKAKETRTSILKLLKAEEQDAEDTIVYLSKPLSFTD